MASRASGASEVAEVLSQRGLPDIAVDLVMAKKTKLEITDELAKLREYFYPNQGDPSRCLPLLDEYPLREYGVLRMKTDIRFMGWLLNDGYNQHNNFFMLRHLMVSTIGGQLLFLDQDYTATNDDFDGDDIDQTVSEACDVLMNKFGIKTKEEAEVVFWRQVKKEFLETDNKQKEIHEIYSQYKDIFKRDHFALDYYNQ